MELTAQRYVERLQEYASPVEREKIRRYFKSGEGQYGEGDVFLGVRMGQVFSLSDAFKQMPVGEIEQLLESPVHEVRAAAANGPPVRHRALRQGAAELLSHEEARMDWTLVRAHRRRPSHDLGSLPHDERGPEAGGAVVQGRGWKAFLLRAVGCEGSRTAEERRPRIAPTCVTRGPSAFSAHATAWAGRRAGSRRVRS